MTFFNILSVLILLPLEMATGMIQKGATAMAAFFYGIPMGGSFSSPIKMAIKPVVGFDSTGSLVYDRGSRRGLDDPHGWIHYHLSSLFDRQSHGEPIDPGADPLGGSFLL